VLCRKGGVALALSEDHKPELDRERERIHNGNGYIENGRVNGNLNLSRAIGDLMYKKNKELELKDQIITSYPEVMEVALEEEDEFMVLGCDGVWEIKSNQQVVDFVRQRIPIAKKEGKPLSWIAGEFLDTILSPDISSTEGLGCDNMTMVIV